MRLRVRGPQGAVQISLDASTATWSDLRHEISTRTATPDFDLKYGYPPQPFNTESIDGGTKLADLPIKLDGEQLIVMPRNLQAGLSSPLGNSHPPPPNAVGGLPKREQVSAPQHQASDFPPQPLSLQRSSQKAGALDAEPPEIPVPALDGVMLLRVMPDDNSCLFRALSSAVLGSALDGMTELRSIVAQTIAASPELYTEGLLEKEPGEYCKWIQREDSWGGGIELSILSQHFDIEVCSLNVQDLRIDRFNEGRPTRCIVVYSGIHYDVCALSPFRGADPEFDRKVFEVVRTGEGEEEAMDGGALEAARELCKVLQGRHYFTDTHGFDVACGQCGQKGKGQMWAVEHARTTGHTSFTEPDA
ncbi:ubiquitin-specific protease otu1 [Teratosphaeriaceae sp. CCFEE 6253]|nr:ubiquitin-specific protease otu1 [Teratosphaeriaceae sp. CCFEE 6253]